MAAEEIRHRGPGDLGAMTGSCCSNFPLYRLIAIPRTSLLRIGYILLVVLSLWSSSDIGCLSNDSDRSCCTLFLVRSQEHGYIAHISRTYPYNGAASERAKKGSRQYGHT